MRGAYDLFIGIGWILFWVYWFISATSSKRNKYSNFGRWWLVRVAILIFVVLTFRLSSARNPTLAYSSLAIHNLYVATLGVILFVAGLAFAIWARVYLGKNWGMPMSQKEEPELVTSGPYTLVRHPIYTGMIAAMLGTLLAVSFAWLFAFVLLSIYFIFSATREEKYLAHTFPKAFPSYKKRTKMLIPYLF